MKSYKWVLMLLSLTASACMVSSGIIDDIIKQYKKTSLHLREDYYQNNLPIFSSYDYVIAGASPSGCVIANRLTEDPDTQVLLLEAGPEPNLLQEIPLLNLLAFNTEFNWNFRSQYNPNVCRSMNDERCPWPSGRGIGGGTAINALLYTRGNKQDYDNWATQGNAGWSYEDLLKYFNKVEDVTIPNIRDSPYRGKDGPLSVSYSPYRSNASIAFIQAGGELGYPEIDYNQPYKAGFAKMQLSMKNGARSSASTAYLMPVTRRANLHVVQRALVSKILIDPQSKIAYGVRFLKKGKMREVRARREVIVSAGAFGSPKLLMLSGIGPKEHLNSLGIHVLQELPVGDNLQEHVGVTSLSFTSPSESFVPNFAKVFSQLPITIVEYLRTRDGPASSSGVDSIAYVSSRYATDDKPDIELMFVGASYASDYGNQVRKTIGVRDDVYNSYYKKLEGSPSFSIWVMGCYPKSKGTVRLSSKNPLIDPIINNNFLNYTEDVNVIVDGIKFAIKLIETGAMKKYGSKLFQRSFPGCENFIFGSDDYWACTVRQITAQYHHQSGTCKMGPDEDSAAVVDNRLRVRGIRNLRVADCSIIPTIPAGHTQAPAFMIGEKAADMIKEDNNRIDCFD